MAKSDRSSMPPACVAGASDARRAFVRRVRGLGFGLDQVRALLDLADQPEHDCAAVDVVARARLAEVDRKLADLAALRRELADLVDRCGHGRVAECWIMEALLPAG